MQNPRYFIRRVGTDGNTVTFSAAAGDNINGASSYVWTAQEPDAGWLRCSGAGVSGEYWAFTPYTTQPTTTKSLNITQQFTTAGGLIGMGTFSNLVPYSSLLTNAIWAQQSNPAYKFAVTGAQTDPLGGNTAVQLVTGATAGNYATYANTAMSVSPATTYCVSAWFKGGAGGESGLLLAVGARNVAFPALTTSWALYSTTITTITGTTGFLLEQSPFPVSPYTIYFAYPQVTLGACPAVGIYVPTATTAITSQVGAFAPTFDAGAYLTSTNCMSTASPTCGSSAAGAFSIAVSATSTTVSTTAVTAASSIEVTPDESVGSALGVTCNTTAAVALAGGGVSARVAGTSFTYSTSATVTTNPVCFSYHITN